MNGDAPHIAELGYIILTVVVACVSGVLLSVALARPKQPRFALLVCGLFAGLAAAALAGFWIAGVIFGFVVG